MVLVDRFTTIGESQILVNWLVGRSKSLTTVYVTHGHGGHFLGLPALLARFPEARAVAFPAVVEAMRGQPRQAWKDGFWRRLFPDSGAGLRRRPARGAHAAAGRV
ncbi:MBL fold metallo-hydrolase [Roseomonas marmotae]|uniref:MBL fold metallo-hydrolase n=1 Tax=Roseomonas marmotae TaxID=2768161 RepID=A0ABS3KI27_9PROT|nr:hypothetical protein [Roseomonas marmotae]MBO1077128.1 hypothetical protein [Roseomonas marmotae]QTI81156.1 hypothetical protein IAI58_17540 [Roseomonas marmotae]